MVVFGEALSIEFVWVRFFNFDSHLARRGVGPRMKNITMHVEIISNWVCHVVCSFKWFDLNQNVCSV